MNNVIRNVLAVVTGLFFGSIINMGILNISHLVIPPPKGIDVTTYEGLLEAIKLFEPKHYIMPFLAHALGTLAGALMASLIAKKRKLTVSMIVGCFFLVGGLINIVMIPAPIWFILLDLVFAYMPMALIASKLFKNKL